MGINEKGLMVSVLTKPLPDDDIMAIFSYVSYKKNSRNFLYTTKNLPVFLYDSGN
jgi:hypothetical protein